VYLLAENGLCKVNAFLGDLICILHIIRLMIAIQLTINGTAKRYTLMSQTL